MHDVISRQAAIDAIVAWAKDTNEMPDGDDCIMIIGDLPSAQPEIIHCKDCKHHHYDNRDIPYCDRIDYGYGWEDDDFCSRADRRTDEGGTG